MFESDGEGAPSVVADTAGGLAKSTGRTKPPSTPLRSPIGCGPTMEVTYAHRPHPHSKLR